MALNTVSSDRLSTNVKNTNFTAAEKQDLTNDILPLASQFGQSKNLILNGACLVSQRATSSTTNGYSTVDRFKTVHSGTDEAPTYAQVDVAAGTTPYTSGFRKALKITNGNQTSGAGAADFISYAYRIEAQDIANSGWNYVSSSSYITLSFWIKSSVAQDFKGYIRSHDGTSQAYAFATGSLSADTWTKITKTISGNSNLTFDNNNNVGFELVLGGFWGTDYTDNSVTENAWAAYASGTRMKDNTSTWYTTNDATLEITGVQLEVGRVATEFEHRSFGEELKMCKRYYEQIQPQLLSLMRYSHHSGNGYYQFYFEVEKRAAPTGSYSNSFVSSSGYAGNPTFGYNDAQIKQAINIQGSNSVAAGGVTYLHGDTSDPGICKFDAEL